MIKEHKSWSSFYQSLSDLFKKVKSSGFRLPSCIICVFVQNCVQTLSLLSFLDILAMEGNFRHKCLFQGILGRGRIDISNYNDGGERL